MAYLSLSASSLIHHVSIFEVTKGAVNEMSNDYHACGIPLINNILSKTVNELSLLKIFQVK
jgi:hypothetical protein